MSSKVTISQSKGVRFTGLFAIIVGIIMIVAGGLVYWQVSSQLRAEKITVSEDADFFAGQRVSGPLTAYAQAEVINKHALDSSGGLTYAELSQDDPARATMMNASFLRASLFTSVVAFGVAVLVMGLGLLFILVGWALRRVSAGPAVVVESFDGAAPRHAATQDEPGSVDEAKPAPAVLDDAETAPPARVSRRSAAVDSDGAAPRGGAAVAEALTRHARPVGDDAAGTDSGPAPVGDGQPAAASAQRTEIPSFDDIYAEPTLGSTEIPIPPSQSWQSPAQRAQDIAGSGTQDDGAPTDPAPETPDEPKSESN